MVLQTQILWVLREEEGRSFSYRNRKEEQNLCQTVFFFEYCPVTNRLNRMKNGFRGRNFRLKKRNLYHRMDEKGENFSFEGCFNLRCVGSVRSKARDVVLNLSEEIRHSRHKSLEQLLIYGASRLKIVLRWDQFYSQ